MKKLFLALSVLFALNLFSQTEKTLQTISLSGQASKKVSPDLAVVTFNISAKNKMGNEALTKLNTQTQQVVDKLTSSGFTKDQLKIANYSLYEDFDYSSAGKSKKLGYVAQQTITLKFKMDKEKLSKLFSTFSEEQIENTTFNFSTEISEELRDKISKELITDAIKDATNKANIIAGAAMLKIKTVKEIQYNVQANFFGKTAIAFKKGSYNEESAPSISSIDAQEIELTEEVSMVFLVE